MARMLGRTLKSRCGCCRDNSPTGKGAREDVRKMRRRERGKLKRDLRIMPEDC